MVNDGLSDEDRRLWERIAAGVEPSNATRARLREAKRRQSLVPPAPAKPNKPAKPATQARQATTPAPPAPPIEGSPPPPSRGRVAGVDRRTSERLRRGNYPVEDRLDLHGMRQDQAHRALGQFIRRSHAAGLRCVLIITGKGGRGRASDDGPYVNPEPPGVLKRRVPEWLGSPDLAALILSTATATTAHGGGGALYVLLKRRREK